MPLRLLTPSDRPLLEKLLAGNPFKGSQIQFQKLDADKLVAFHSASILSQASDPESPVWIFERGGHLGLVGIRKSDIHSSFFGLPVFSIEPVISYLLRADEKRELVCSIGDILESKGARVVWGKCDENEGDLPKCFFQVGADYCGTTIRMSRWMDTSQTASHSEGIRIREVTREDLPALRRIAAEGHTHSHFLRDPNLPEERKLEVFPAYMTRCFGQTNRPFLTAEDERGELLGFSLLLCPSNQMERLGQTIGIVDFIVIHPEARNRGVGSSLLGASYTVLRDHGYNLIELKTMLDNLNAITFYQKHGFRILSAEMNFSIGSTVTRWTGA